VGYPKETLGYYFYNRSEGKVFVARNGVFLEKEFLKGEKNGKTVRLEEVQDEPIGQESMSDASVAEQVEISMAREAPPQPRRSARLRELWEILLLDNDEPVTCKSNDGPRLRKMVECHAIRDRVHGRQSSLELG